MSDNPGQEPEEQYVDEHQALLEEALSNAVTECIRVRPADPLAFVSRLLLSAGDEEGAGPADEEDGEENGEEDGDSPDDEPESEPEPEDEPVKAADMFAAEEDDPFGDDDDAMAFVMTAESGAGGAKDKSAESQKLELRLGQMPAEVTVFGAGGLRSGFSLSGRRKPP